MSVRDSLIAMVRRPEDVGAILANLSPAERDEALRAAVVHGLGTTAAVACHDAQLPVPDWLEAHRFDLANRRAHLLAALGTVGPALDAAGITWAVLKGPVVATYYTEPLLREAVDLDILVPGHRLAAALEAMKLAGASRYNLNWDGPLRYGAAEFPVFVAGMPFDVHWHLIGLHRDRRGFDIPMVEMMERVRPFDLSGVAAGRLDPEDNAIHVALHAGLGGGWRLAGLRDIQQITASADLNWDKFVSRARAYGAGPLVGHVLDRAGEVLGDSVPPGVVEALAPAAALRARRRLDSHLRRTPEQLWSGIVIASARRGVAGTLTAAALQLEQRLRSVIGRDRHWSAYDPESPLYWEREPQDPTAYKAYLGLAAGG